METVKITREFLELKEGHHFEWINDALYISILDNEMKMYFIHKGLGWHVGKTPPENTEGYEYMVKFTDESNKTYRKAIRAAIRKAKQEIGDDWPIQGVDLDDVNQVINACREVRFDRHAD